MSRLSSDDVREARQASRHLPDNDLDAAHLLAVILRTGQKRGKNQT